ncbi:hypothetical protein BGW36DRAFT_424224 [Talaromyces proteolyticus]|uniref:Enoyl reductase (ER) domain-containing protein n=1 Tax=Talaromyces proteolyticus TaxID=1131652 RepID=A0AAD4KYL5_9EURO|nr:uncharacterized protein BGW36DRAFT_424224 [Talaromyces proteolyticus]KAH8701927.1 hypothetical protein BGW36DRAFT_424224 [Talaromyces proteolyticus]
MTPQTRQWILQTKPQAGNKPTFTLLATPIPPLLPNQALVKPLYFSNDPAQHVWMTLSPRDQHPARPYAAPIEPGDPIPSFAIAQVIESLCTRIPVGRLVYARVTWSDLSIINSQDCLYTLDDVLPTDAKIGITHFMGALGLSGLTAHYGLYDIACATANDSIVISGAAGAVGSMAVQIAKKMIGCKYVIGIAGTDEKCRFVEGLGADECLNYRSGSFEEDLQRVTKDCVDVYFDNVGGWILDLMLKRLKSYGRVAACGAISQYQTPITGLTNYVDIVTMRLQILGFNVVDAIHKSSAVTNAILEAWSKGILVLSDDTETVVDATLEDVPSTWMGIFRGENKGKMITRVVHG